MVEGFEQLGTNLVAHTPEKECDASRKQMSETFISLKPQKILELSQLLDQVPGTVRIQHIHPESIHTCTGYSLSLVITFPYLPTATFPGGLSARDAGNLFLQLAETVEFSHRKGIIHANICPGALYCSDDGRVLLGNYRFFFEAYENTTTGNAFEESEVCESNPAASDIYSLGKLFLFIATGKTPKTLSSFDFLCPNFYTLVKSMTTKDKEKRSSISDVLNMIKSGFTVNGKLAMYKKNASPLSRSSDDTTVLEMHKQILDDLQFHESQKSNKVWIFQLLSQSISQIASEDKQKLHKPIEIEARQLQSFAQSSLETGTVYQRNQFYPLALYCYLRAALALKLAKKGLKGDWNAVREVQKKLRTCVVNYISLKNRLGKL